MTPAAKTKTMWLGVYMLSIPLGMAMGMALSSTLSSDDASMSGRAPWRTAFLVSGLGGIPFVIGAMCYPSHFSPTRKCVVQSEEKPTATEALPSGSAPEAPYLHSGGPASNSSSDEAQGHAHPWDAFKRLIVNKIYVSIVIGMGTYTLVLNATSTFQQPMLRFGPWGLSQSEASNIMAASAIPALFGAVVGGVVLDKMGGSAGPEGLFRCFRQMFIIGVVCFPVLFVSYYVYNIGGYVILSLGATMAIMSITSPASAATLNCVDKDIRTYAMSIAALVEKGIALPGPTIIGALIDSFSDGCHDFTQQEICENIAPTGTTTAPFVPHHKECVWMPGKRGANGDCINVYENRNAIALFSVAFIGIVIAWGVALVLSNRKKKETTYSAAVIA